ncbi:MAG: M48 family metallopeptidase [Leptospirales bacterium]
MDSHTLLLPDGSIQPVMIRTGARRHSYSIRWIQELPFLTVPRGTSLLEAARILEKHRRWFLRRKQSRERERTRQPAIHPPVHQGEMSFGSIPYGGESLFFHWIEENTAGLDHDPVRNCLVLKGPSPAFELFHEKIREWIFVQFTNQIHSHLSFWIQKTGLNPSGVSVRTTRSQWGSMSRKRHLSLSWFLLGQSPECLGYVILHELIHIRHPNHSKMFWSTLEQYLSDHKRIRAGLVSFLHYPDWGTLLPGNRKNIRLERGLD